MHKPAIQKKINKQTDPYFAAIRTLPKHHVKTLSAWRQGSQPLKVEEKQIATLFFFLGGFSPPIDAFSILLKPFNSHEWPRQNFSSQYQNTINHISDENKEKYQFEDN